MPNENEQSGLINNNTSPSVNQSPTSGVTMGVSEIINSNTGFSSSDVTDFLQTIKGVMQSLLNDFAPKAILGKITKRVSDIRYDVEVLSGNESRIIHNILNNTRFDYQEGDYVEILDTQNNLNTAYISCARSIPLQTEYREVTGTGELEEEIIDDDGFIVLSEGGGPAEIMFVEPENPAEPMEKLKVIPETA